jgi:hypothetical protein
VLLGVGLLPALLTLTVWKERGLGDLPVLAMGQVREAAGPVVAARVGRYVPWDPHHLSEELRDLMEVFWSVRLLVWIALAGVIAALRRGRARGAFLAVRFVMFCLVKGSSDQASVNTTSYFRLTEPGLPAFVLLAAAIVYLVPARRERLTARPPRPAPRWAVAAAVVIGGALPLALVLAVRPQPGPGVTVRDNQHATEAPIDAGWTARRSGNRLTWSPVEGHGARVHYLVLRVDPTTGGCTRPETGANECYLEGTRVATTRATSVVVPQAAATYRVAAAANYIDEPNGGDLMLLGAPVTVP